MDRIVRIIREAMQSAVASEAKINIEDAKKRGYATQIGKMFADTFKAFHPIQINGKIGVSGDEFVDISNNFGVKNIGSVPYDGNFFSITLSSGDVIEIFRISNPPQLLISLSGELIANIDNPSEIFQKNAAEIAKKYYLNSISSKNKF